MRKRAEKIFAAIVGAIPLPGAYHGLSDAENVKSVIEAELTAAVREEREKWEAAVRDMFSKQRKNRASRTYETAVAAAEAERCLAALLTEAP